MDTILKMFEYASGQIKSITVFDIIDILLVALIFYYTFKFVKDRRAGKLLMGILFLIVLLIISELLQMRALNFILSNVFSVGFIAIIVVFQPELRSALEKMGGESLRGIMGKLDKDQESALKAGIAEVCVAAESLSNTKTGALIVFERGTRLGDYIRTGTVIDAHISSFLITNIFHDKAPLHDGAVIIREGRIHAAGCFLPLSTNTDIVKELGTRHRAGIGMSENSDAVVLIVSEESGMISIAIDGELKRGFSARTLQEKLEELLIKGSDNVITKKVKGRFFDKK